MRAAHEPGLFGFAHQPMFWPASKRREVLRPSARESLRRTRPIRRCLKRHRHIVRKHYPRRQGWPTSALRVDIPTLAQSMLSSAHHVCCVLCPQRVGCGHSVNGGNGWKRTFPTGAAWSAHKLAKWVSSWDIVAWFAAVLCIAWRPTQLARGGRPLRSQVRFRGSQPSRHFLVPQNPTGGLSELS